jgi:hypothetical protein
MPVHNRPRIQPLHKSSKGSLQTLSIMPTAREDLEVELIEQELFLHDPRTEEVHCLNSGAAIIWLLCDGTRSARDIATEIATEYGLPEQDVLADVQEMLGRLQALGLFTIDDRPGERSGKDAQ